jgi:hypothetical protein
MRLTERDRRTLAAFAGVLVPEGGSLPSASSVDVAGTVARYIDAMGRAQVVRLVSLVRFLSIVPLSTGRFRRFRNLSPRGRERVVRRMAHGRGYRKQLYGGLKQLVMVAWASTPEVSAAIGYDGSCLADSPDRLELVGPFLPAQARPEVPS